MNAQDLEYSDLGYFWQIKNDRAISIHETKSLTGILALLPLAISMP